MLRASVFLRVLVIGCLIFGAASFCYADNLFVDPGFENGVNDWATIGYPFSATNAFVHGGLYAAQNTIITVDTQDYYGQVYQIVEPVVAGNPVYMEGWVKTNFAQGSSARGGILVEFLAADDSVIDSIKTEMSGVNNWFKIYTTGIAPAGTAKVRAGAFIYAARYDIAAIGGTIYVDDLSIDKTQAPGDLLTNTGFESQLSGWTTGTGGSPFGYTTAETHSGTYSATDTIDTVASQNYYGIIYQVKPFSVGSHLYASAWGKAAVSPLAGAKGGLIVQFLNSSGGVIGSALQSEIGGQTDWRQLYVDGIAPSGTVNVRVGAYLWAARYDTNAVNGKFYVDDFVATTTPISPPPPAVNLVDGGFENGVNEWKWQYRPFVATNSVVHQGTYAAQHTIGDTNGSFDYLALAYQDFPFSQGQTGYITGWGKSVIDPGKNAVGGIQIEFLDSLNAVLLLVQDNVGGNTDWKSLYAYGLAPSGTVKVRVSGYAWAARNQGTINGNVYLDDITFSNTPPSSLVLNPGFENGLSGWTQDTEYPMATTNLEHYSGSNSATGTIQLPGGNADFNSRIYQEFAYDSGYILYATLWAKTNFSPSSTGVAGLKIEFLNDANTVLGSAHDTIQGQTGWSYLYIAALAPSGTTKARVGPFIYCPHATASLGGSAYFDDVAASHAPLPPKTFPTTLINVGFETGLSPWIDLYGLPTQIVSDPHSQSYSAKKTIGTTPDADYYSIAYQDIYYNNQATPFPAAQDVYLTAYVKSNINPAANAAGGIKIEYYDADNVSHEIGKDQVSAINSWRQLYVKATIPAAAKKVRVMGFAWAKEGDALSVNGTVNFDDFVYSYDPIAAPPLPTTLQNPGFENGLNDWDVPFKPAFVETNPSIVYAGNYAAGLLIDYTIGQDYYGRISQDVAVVARKVVTAKVWAKTVINPASNAKARLYIVFFDAIGNFITMHGSLQQLGGNTDWTQLAVSATAPTNTARVQVRCELYASESDSTFGGIAYFDAATLSITSGGGCLLPGTKITLADGTLKAIEAVQKGDKVLGVKEDGKLLEIEVTETFFHPKNEGFLVITTQDNRTLKLTANHPVRNHIDYVEAGSLKVGDEISILNNKKLTPIKIISIITDNSPVDVYNLEVSKTHNYFADGCLVHNKLPQRYMEDAGGNSGPR